MRKYTMNKRNHIGLIVIFLFTLFIIGAIGVAQADLINGLPADGLVAWFDANDLTGLSDGDPVTLWQKKAGIADVNDFEDWNSGDNFAPTYVASSSIFGGLPCLSFVNPHYDDYLVSQNLVADYLSGQSLTVFFVSQANFHGLWNAAVPRLYFQGHQALIGTAYETCLIGYPTDDTTSAIRTFTIDVPNKEAQGWMDGHLEDTEDLGSLPSSDFLYAGQNGLRAGAMHAGSLAEVLIFNRVLTSYELNQVGYYLKDKYNIQQAEYTKPPEAPKVLYINDSTNVYTCQSPYQLPGQPFTDDKLRESVNEVAGKVDVHMLEVYGWVPWWNSTVYPGDQHYIDWEARTGLQSSTFGQYMKNGGDVIATFVDQCRLTDQSPFISFRLNDTHHLDYLDPADPNEAGTEHLSQFLWDNISYSLATYVGDRKGLNWIYQDVVAHKLAMITEICENYDIDGLELDFMRAEYYFDTAATTSSQRINVMLDFVESVRQVLNDTSPEGQYRWLCVRIPCLISRHDALGIDVSAFEQAGVDMFNLSASSYAVQDNTDIATIKQNLLAAKVYHELTQAVWVPSFRNIENLDGNARDFQLYTAAMKAYDRGADGISVFNFAYYRGASYSELPYSEPPFHVLSDLGSYGNLLQKNRHWYYIADNYYPVQVPYTFNGLSNRTFNLDINKTDHLFNADGLLRFVFEEDVDQSQWSAQINGHDVDPVDIILNPINDDYQTPLGRSEQYLCFGVPMGYVENGTNSINLSKNDSGLAVLHYVDLVISPDLYIYDFDDNRLIDISDLGEMLSHWLNDNCEPEWCQRADLNQDSFVNLYDYADFASYWFDDISQPVPNSLKAWYKADDIELLNGQTVTEWPNSFGQAGPFMKYSGSPTYYSSFSEFSGKPAVTFDNSDALKDYMIGSNIVSQFLDNSELTLFMVSKGNYFGIYNAGIPRLYMRGHQFIIGDPSLTLAMGNTDVAIKVYSARGVKDGDGFIEAWVNGISKGTISTTAQGGLYDFGGTGHFYMPSLGSTGTVAEIIIYNEALDSDQLNAVGYYLENKYGISTTYYEPSSVEYPEISNIPIAVGGN